ncbi:alpha/beta hydrolase [Streptomyces sp. 110]|uniref:Alpha/beta hydrolase n=1 Tax=Streptomyces endocoffeicus TaxID=2898945 RepID=A0ABS1PSN3_9ACTN|nr:alpha/beta hydrolase [Streptomyces endocoffeicus]MBL1115445.1 alpha/beta hydrolase [Streptomyces endocoffeicus]
MSFVLIHGATCTAGIWGRLIPLLYGDVLAVDLPGRGTRADTDLRGLTLEGCAKAVAEDIVQRDLTDVTLVAHSFSGVVAPRVMALLPERIQQVVLLAAVVPPDRTPVAEHMDARLKESLERRAINGVYTFGIEAAGTRLCTDGDDDEVQYVLDHLVEDAKGLLTESVDLSGYQLRIPRAYIQLAHDWSYAPRLQAESAQRTRANCVTLNAGHMAMVTIPHQMKRMRFPVRDDEPVAVGQVGFDRHVLSSALVWSVGW